MYPRTYTISRLSKLAAIACLLAALPVAAQTPAKSKTSNPPQQTAPSPACQIEAGTQAVPQGGVAVFKELKIRVGSCGYCENPDFDLWCRSAPKGYFDNRPGNDDFSNYLACSEKKNMRLYPIFLCWTAQNCFKMSTGGGSR